MTAQVYVSYMTKKREEEGKKELKEVQKVQKRSHAHTQTEFCFVQTSEERRVQLKMFGLTETWNRKEVGLWNSDLPQNVHTQTDRQSSALFR